MQRNELIKQTLRYIIYLETYRRGQVKLIQRELKRLYYLIQSETKDKKLINNLILISLINDYLNKINEFGSSLREHLLGQFQKVVQLENNFMQTSVNEATGENKKLKKLTPEEIIALVSIATFFSKTIQEQIDAFINSQKKIIRSAVRNEFNKNNKENVQTTPEQISRALSRVLKKSLFQADSFVSTAFSFVSNEARSKIIEKNPNIYDSYLCVALLDNHTCPLCLSRDGKIFNSKNKVPLPAHWKCRCEYVPVLKSKYEENSNSMTRPAEFGEDNGNTKTRNISQSINVDSYLRMQPLWFIEDVLGGKAKAQLFLNGGLSIKDFVASATSSKIRTLEELYEKWPESFEDAGIDPPPQT